MAMEGGLQTVRIIREYPIIHNDRQLRISGCLAIILFEE